MDIKKAAKKIVALGGSSAMVAMSLTGALAYDLADYPEPFIQDGQFDGKIVVGENAATEDLLGALDIATHLQQASTDGDTGGSSGGMSGGDSLQIEESSDILEIGEQIGSVINTLTDDDLEILMDGRITTEGSTDYTQIIELDGIPSGSGLVQLDENDDDEAGFYLYYANGAQLFNYELEFTSGLDTDVESNVLDDLEDETITMLGKQFSVVASSVSDDEDDLVLELIAGDVVDTLEQGQTRTYEVMDENGDVVDYEITLLAVGTSGDGQARFLVNGESTDSIEEGDTERLSSGLEIGVRDILVLDRNFEGDQGSLVEFYLGANKLEIGPVDSGVASNNVEYNDEDLDDVEVTVSYTGTVDTDGDGDLSISQIAWAVEADDEFYIGEGESLRDYMDEPEALISEDLDFMFGGLSEPQLNLIEFNPDSDEEYTVMFTNRRGDEYDVPYFYAESSTSAKLGEEGSNGDAFHFFERFVDDGTDVTVADTFVIAEDGYFVVTDDQGTADEDADSYVLQFIDVDEDDSTVTFRDVSEGNSDDIEAQIDGTVFDGVVPVADFFTAANITGELRIGGQDYSFWIYDAGNDETDYTLVVDQNGDDDVAGVDAASTADNVEIVNIVTRGGGIMTLGTPTQVRNSLNGTDTDDFNMTLTTVADDVDSDIAQTQRVVFSAVAGPEVDFGSVDNTSGLQQSVTDDDADETWYTNAYGTLFKVQDNDNEPDELEIEYPNVQREALVYVTGGVVEGRQAMGSSGSGVNVNPVDLGLGVLDSDVSVGEDNLIVVGGPCANSIAADLLGNPSDCAEGFEPNMGMIQGFDTDGNVAVLVAGFSATDTIRTSQVLASATVGDEDLMGEAVEVAFPTASGNPVVRTMEDMMDAAMDDEE